MRKYLYLGAAALFVAVCVGVYARFRPVPAPAVTVTEESASATTEKVGATVVEKRGPVTVHRKRTTPTPDGPQVTETTIVKAPVETTTSSEANRTANVQTKTETIIVPRPEKWWRVYGEAGWKVSREIGPVPSRVEAGGDVKVIGPFRLGVKVDADPRQIKDTASVYGTVRAEW